MKNTREKEGQGSLTGKLLCMTIVPLVVLTVLILLYAISRFSSAMFSEVEENLQNVAEFTLDTYDRMYPGAYSMKSGDHLTFYKGEKLLDGDYEILDQIKEETGTEITIFYQDTRILTTIEDENSTRFIGTGANFQIQKDVLDAGTSHFYDGLTVHDISYMVYYAPLYNEDQSIAGMIAVGKPTAAVMQKVYRMILPMLVIAIAAMLLAAVISIRYIRSLILVIKELQDFVSGVSHGKLSENLSENILKRRDEFGQMGHAVVNMQRALKKLVEQDVLTETANRRFGEKKLEEIWKKSEQSGMCFSVAIGDIDFFKKVNDTYGHEAGDEVLKNIAFILKKNMVSHGFVARWGGEEFLMVFAREDLDASAVVLEHALEEIRGQAVEYNEQKISVTMSFGVVEGSTDRPVNQIIKEADDRLYYVKTHGRNRVWKNEVPME
ncbi:MAG: diguanylate cyclase [Lachnospiraceae bacterium]|nr:diguanylate cyclase [Lachnospiraceae bacterium]